MLALYRDVVRLCMEYASHIWGGSTHTALLEKVESRAFCLINSPSLTNFLQSLSASRIVASLYTFAITMATALLNSSVAYFFH